MNRRIMHPRLTLPALGLALAMVACSDETVVAPIFAEKCNVGSIKVGTSVTGAFSEDSPCLDERNFLSGERVPYAAYDVRLEAGKAYMFRQEQIPDPAQEGRDDLDALLAIWGHNESGARVPLAVSDQEGGGDDAELFFIAPRTGTYHVVAASYYGIDEGLLGGYRLLATECPVLGRIDGSGEHEFTLAPSECLRHDPLVAHRFIRIAAKPYERVTIEVDAEEFTPAWEVFGPGMDTYAYLWLDSRYDARNGNGSVELTIGPVGGIITLAVGVVDTDGPDQSFEVTVTRESQPPLDMLLLEQGFTPKLVVPRR